jgi:hypothetical protein
MPKARKKRYTKRAPDAPKSCKSAYLIFSNEKRTEIKATLPPGTKVTDVVKKLAEIWRSLTTEAKHPYNVKAAEDKSRYERERKEFKGALRIPVGRWTGRYDAPKQGCPAFVIFCQLMRPKLGLENSQMTQIEITIELGKMWRLISEPCKEVYKESAHASRTLWIEAMADWDETQAHEMAQEMAGFREVAKRAGGMEQSVVDHLVEGSDGILQQQFSRNSNGAGEKLFSVRLSREEIENTRMLFVCEIELLDSRTNQRKTCGKTFGRFRNLEKHRKKHLDNKDVSHLPALVAPASSEAALPEGAKAAFFCPDIHCKYNIKSFFKTKAAVVEHYKRSHTAKTLQCPTPGCTKMFSIDKDRKVHLRMCTAPPIICKCGASLCSIAALMTHQRRFNGTEAVETELTEHYALPESYQAHIGVAQEMAKASVVQQAVGTAAPDVVMVPQIQEGVLVGFSKAPPKLKAASRGSGLEGLVHAKTFPGQHQQHQHPQQHILLQQQIQIQQQQHHKQRQQSGIMTLQQLLQHQKDRVQTLEVRNNMRETKSYALES